MDAADVSQVEPLIRFHLRAIAGLIAVYCGLLWMRQISRSKRPKTTEQAISESFRGLPIQKYLALGVVFIGVALIAFAFVA